MAGGLRQGMGGKRRADAVGLMQGGVIAFGWGDRFPGQKGAVIVDHGEKIEAGGKDHAAVMQLPQRAGGAGGAAGAGAEEVGRHGDGIGDEARHHQAGCGIGMQHLGRDTGGGGGAGGGGFVGAVDIFGGAFAGDAQDMPAQVPDAVGQPAKAPRRAGEALQGWNARGDGGDVVGHAGPPRLRCRPVCRKLEARQSGEWGSWHQAGMTGIWARSTMPARPKRWPRFMMPGQALTMPRWPRRAIATRRWGWRCWRGICRGGRGRSWMRGAGRGCWGIGWAFWALPRWRGWTCRPACWRWRGRRAAMRGCTIWRLGGNCPLKPGSSLLSSRPGSSPRAMSGRKACPSFSASPGPGA